MKITITIDEDLGIYHAEYLIPDKLDDKNSINKAIRGHFEHSRERSETIATGYRDASWMITAALLNELIDMRQKDREAFIKAENAAYLKSFQPNQ